MTLKIKKPTDRRHPEAEKVSAILQKEETVRLNANVPKRFYREVKKWALEHEMTVTEMVIEALREYMSKYSNEPMSGGVYTQKSKNSKA